MNAEKYEIRRGEFGWALEEMKRGEIVRRPEWEDGITWQLLDGKYLFSTHDEGTIIKALHTHDILANDWALA